MEKLFGTDGVRGIPGRYPLTAEMVSDIASTAARVLLRRASPQNGAAPTVLIGRDTRGSGPALCRQLVRGFAAAGCRVKDLGVVTTPAVSYLTPRAGALCGVVVSASHNPAEFNGIKFFLASGLKMPAELEDEIESHLGRLKLRARAGARAEDAAGLAAGYAEFLRSTLPPACDFSGLRIVVDCGHGAASGMAPGLFEGLGAEVFSLGCAPNGRNINRGCGALDTGAMRRLVKARRADCGVAFDGDADRAIFSDEHGRILDGDVLIALSALRLRAQGGLRGGKVALTVMSNFGMRRFLEREGIGVVATPVGDRHVSDAIEAGGLSLGGEASGHIIFRSLAPTGDGVLTALQIVAALKEGGKSLSHYRGLYRPTPQILKNVRVERRVPLEKLRGFSGELKRCERRLGGEGRVFVRYSGTEPLLRILVEGPRASEVSRMAEGLARTFAREASAT